LLACHRTGRAWTCLIIEAMLKSYHSGSVWQEVGEPVPEDSVSERKEVVYGK
jgi:hypothetical protein